MPAPRKGQRELGTSSLMLQFVAKYRLKQICPADAFEPSMPLAGHAGLHPKLATSGRGASDSASDSAYDSAYIPLYTLAYVARVTLSQISHMCALKRALGFVLCFVCVLFVFWSNSTLTCGRWNGRVQG